MRDIKDIDNDQRLSLAFDLYKNNKGNYYVFYLESNYTNKNISFEYSVEYQGNIYNEEDIFNMDKDDVNELLSEIGNTIIYDIVDLNLNPKIEYEDFDYEKENYLKYEITLLFNDSENVYPKINLEDIFNSIISIFEERNVELENKSLEEIFRKKKKLKFHLITKIHKYL